MAIVTKPVATDETAQTMNTKLQAIADALTPNAGGVSYSNATSGLSAETVQEAIDEVDGNVDNLSASLAQNEVFYKNFDITIATTDTGRTKVISNVVTNAYKIVSISPIYNNDLYYYTANKGMPIISIRDDFLSLSVMASGSTLNDTSDRTLKVKVGYQNA